ncbi:MAG: ROK family protein [bacterium]|nr:ROK family protein [bacterium]
MSPERPRIGVDLGGTKIEAVRIDFEGTVLQRVRRPTPQHDYDATLRAIRDVVLELEDAGDTPARVGVGTPGAVSPATGRMKNANSTWLNDRPLAADLTRALERDVRLANDADCFALSEATDGAARDVSVVFGVILGTGVGGGIVVRGQLLSGPNAIAGEWGHNALPWPLDDERPGPACWCGNGGCIEAWLSGPGLARDHERATNEKLSPAEIVERAEQDDLRAHATLQRYETRLARALAAVINVLDPGTIVLGGGLSNLRRLYDRVPRLWAPFIFSDRVDTRLVPPSHGDSSGVRGAAWLWRPEE